MEFRKAFESDFEIQKFGKNALLIFAMMLKFDEIDPNSLAAESLTDGSGDKKIDFIRFDPEIGRVTLAQGYFSSDWNKPSAKANKAADINTAVSWLISGELDNIDDKRTGLRSKAIVIRDALEEGKVKHLELLYVHNLQESENVRKELDTCANNLKKILSSYKDSPEVTSLEVGVTRINEWYSSRERPILVKDRVTIPIYGGYAEAEGKGWQAIVASTKASVLRELYEIYEDSLFSANLRGFLGVRESARNINQKIKETAEKSPTNFWIYNNGITVITNSIEPSTNKVVLNGIAVINGAQTTGSLSRARSNNLDNADVMIRIIVTKDRRLINNIVKYNNTQNIVYTWELRNGDKIQTRLNKEFKELNLKYSNRRSTAIKPSGEVVPVPAASQALMAFHGKPLIALKGKTEIFESDSNYSFIFHDYTTAQHICFVYSIVIAYDEFKNSLKAKSEVLPLMETEKKHLEYTSLFSFKQFHTFCIGHSIEDIIGNTVTDKYRLRFTDSKSGLKCLAEKWSPIIPVIINEICNGVESSNELLRVMKSDDRMLKLGDRVKGHIVSMRMLAPEKFDTFSRELVF